MRLIEKCRCGGQIEVVYGTGSIASTSSDRERDMNEGRAQLDTWRKAHLPCHSIPLWVGPPHV